MWGGLVARKKQKHATEMTSDEIAKFVFPKEVHETAKRLAHSEKPPRPGRKSPQEKSND